MQEKIKEILDQIETVIVGKNEVMERILMAILADVDGTAYYLLKRMKVNIDQMLIMLDDFISKSDGSQIVSPKAKAEEKLPTGAREFAKERRNLSALDGFGVDLTKKARDGKLDPVIGRKKEKALHLADLFLKMIKSGVTDDELRELEEAGALQDVSHMPARVKCAVLGWHTMEEMLDKQKSE